jgi:hypothetical protein
MVWEDGPKSPYKGVGDRFPVVIPLLPFSSLRIPLRERKLGFL